MEPDTSVTHDGADPRADDARPPVLASIGVAALFGAVLIGSLLWLGRDWAPWLVATAGGGW